MADAADRHCLVAELPCGPTTFIDRGRGPVLVMIHGVGLNADVWAPQVEAFTERHRVVAYDTLGHGGSAMPPAGATLPDYVGQLGALLDALDIERAVAMGHSMGALVALLFAIEQPGRVGALIAANPVYRRPERQLAASRERLRRLEEDGAGATVQEVLLRWVGDEAALASPPAEQLRQWLGSADREGYAAAYRVFSEADPWLDGRLRNVVMPALFITGENDPNSTPAMAHAMAAEAPLGRAVVLEGERHMMTYVSPERFNPVVRGFLNETAAGGHAPSTNPNRARQA